MKYTVQRGTVSFRVNGKRVSYEVGEAFEAPPEVAATIDPRFITAHVEAPAQTVVETAPAPEPEPVKVEVKPRKRKAVVADAEALV